MKAGDFPGFFIFVDYNFCMHPNSGPSFRIGQFVYVQYDLRVFRKRQKVKVRRVMAMIGGYRYEIEQEYLREWCMENEIGRKPPIA